MIKSLVLALLLWSCHVSVWAAERSLSWDQLADRVYRDHPGLWRLRQEQQLWDARIQQAGLGPNPELSLVSEDIAGSAAFSADRFTQFSLGLAQNLVLANKTDYRVQLARFQKQINEWEYRVQLREVSNTLYRLYAKWSMLHSQIQSVKALSQLSLAQHQVLEKMVASGRLAEVALLQSEAHLKGFEAELLRFKQQEQQLSQEIAALWGASEPDFERLSGALVLTQHESWDVLEQRLQQHPRLLRWGVESQQRQVALDAALAQKIPDLNLEGAMRYHPPLDWGLVLSLGAQLPLINANQGNIEEARLRQTSLTQERELTYRELLGRLREAYLQFQHAQQRLALQDSRITLMQAQSEAVWLSFQAGKVGVMEVLVSQQQLLRLQQERLELESTRLLALADIRALTHDWTEQDTRL